MASSSTDTALENDNDANHGPKRTESKRRKFKPFSAVRRLFSGGKSKHRSTGDEEYDAESDAKGRPTSAPVDESLEGQRLASMGDNRNITDDNIMSPEQKDASVLRAQKMATTTDKNQPKSALQAELASKLHKRRSFCSEEDEEDGLRQGLAPPGNTTDFSVEDSVKEDDLFHSQWTSSVSSASSQSNTGRRSQETHGSLDLSSMARTELLKSDAAKDRISVKPRSRKTNWQTRKRKEARYSLSLPSLAEVDSSGSGQTPHPGGRPQSEYIDPSVLSDFDLNMIPSAVSAVELTSPERREANTWTAPTHQPSTPTPSSDVSTTVQSNEQGLQNVSSKSFTSQTSQSTKSHRVSFATEKAEPESVPAPVTQVIASSPTISLPQERETQVMAVSVPAPEKRTMVSPPVVLPSPEMTVSVTPDTSPQPVAASSSSVSVSADRKKEGLRQADSHTEDSFSPKPDYKARRQQRSRTLPVQQPVVKVQRTASQRGDSSSDHVRKHGEREEETVKSEEPGWVALARRKTQRHNEESQQPASSVSAPVKQSPESASFVSAAVKQSPESCPSVSINIATTPTTKIATATGNSVTITLPPTQSVSMPSVNSGIVIVSSDTAVNRNQAGDKWNGRGGSIKTSHNTTSFLTSRGGSVRVTAPKSQPSSSFTSSSSTPSLPGNIPDSSSSASTSAISVNGEPKTFHSTLVVDPRNRETQSTKTPPIYLSSSSLAVSSPAPKATQPLSSSLRLTSSSSLVVSSPAPKATQPLSSSLRLISSSSLAMSSPAPKATQPLSSSVHLISTSAKLETRPMTSAQTSSSRRPVSQVEKKSGTPAWRTEVIQRTLNPSNVKIELIENTPSSVAFKIGGKTTAKSSLEESVAKVGGDISDLPADQCRTSVSTKRHSRVMDLLKNFENLQSVS